MKVATTVITLLMASLVSTPVVGLYTFEIPFVGNSTIPDGQNQVWIRFSIYDPCVVNDVRVVANITHTSVSDLILKLVAPNGDKAILAKRPCLGCDPGYNANLDASEPLVFHDDANGNPKKIGEGLPTDEIIPSKTYKSVGRSSTTFDRLMDLDGTNSFGNWTLRVEDANANNETGFITGATLVVTGDCQT